MVFGSCVRGPREERKTNKKRGKWWSLLFASWRTLHGMKQSFTSSAHRQSDPQVHSDGECPETVVEDRVHVSSLSNLVKSWEPVGTDAETDSPSLADLPDELVTCIMKHIPGTDILKSAALVCRQWTRVSVQDNALWKTLYSKDFCRGRPLDDMEPKRTWRDEYLLECRWRHGQAHETHYMGLLSHVYSVDFNADKTMVVGRSVDGLTKVWDLEGGECTHTVAGARLMSCVQSDEKKIVGASLDGSIVVWDVATRHVLRTLVGHAHLATCLQFDDERVVSGSLDRTIRVWNANTGECLQTMTGHKSTVMCIRMKGSILVSGSNDGEVKVWNLETGECIHTLIGHKGWVTCVDFDDLHVVSGSHDCTLRVWGLESGKKIGKLRGHTGSIMCVQLEGKRVVTGSLDSRVKLWDLWARKCVRSFRGHTSYVSCVKFDDRRILAGADDGSVRCWEISDQGRSLL